MIVTDAPTWKIIYDMFLIFGLSVILWLCFHFINLIFPLKRVVAAVVVYVVFFAVAGLLVFCFIIGETQSRQPRWHMAAGFALGAWVYYSWFSRYTKQFVDLIKKLATILWKPVVLFLRFVRGVLVEKAIVYLQKKRAVLYNKLKQAGIKRRKRRGKNSVKTTEDKEKRKEPIQAYTQS